MPMLLRALVLATIVLMAACGGKDPVNPVENGSIRGTVTDASGVGMPNVAIELTGNGATDRTANTGADGVYTFNEVPVGAYTLVVARPDGYTIGSATLPVTVAGGAEASASAFVFTRVVVVDCPLARPYFGIATESDRALFSYDASAPLNLISVVESAQNGVRLSNISYASPDGGLVTGIVAEPTGRTGLRPGLVLMHPSGQPAQGMAPYAKSVAQNGAVVIAIDAPYFRRGRMFGPLFSVQDREEHVQLIKDLQRAVDVLLARADVDPSRIAFEGYSYGGMVGAHFVGIEKRIKAAVLAAAFGGHLTGMTTPGNLAFMASLSCATRSAWYAAMTPVEPIRFIPQASPTALLFQMGLFDTAVLPVDAQALYDAAPQPKEARWYSTGHSLNQQALWERHDWLHAQIGIDPRSF